MAGLLQGGKISCCFSRIISNRNIETIGAEVAKIPPRSPDLNPIKTFFYNVKKKLRQDAIRDFSFHKGREGIERKRTPGVQGAG